MDFATVHVLVLAVSQQLFTALLGYVGVHEEDCEKSHTDLNQSLMRDRHTSAEASDVTSIRFSARKANTAAARTRGSKEVKSEKM